MSIANGIMTDLGNVGRKSGINLKFGGMGLERRQDDGFEQIRLSLL